MQKEWRNTPVTVGKMTSSAKKRVSHLGRFHGKTQDDQNKIGHTGRNETLDNREHSNIRKNSRLQP
jgi:hypothetical protein